MYIAPIRKSIIIRDGQFNSDSDIDEEPTISTTKSRTIEDPIVISDDEVDIMIRVNTQQNSNHHHRTANETLFYQNQNYMDDEEISLSINDFRLNMLNKLHLKHQITEESFTQIIIRSRSYICDDVLNWINDASIYDLIKKPFIDILDEE